MSHPRREKASPAPDGELFPIRTIARLTGVNPITLRGWERRYGVIKPVRTPKGHRLYAHEHIDLIHRALALLDKGMSISQVRRALESKSAPRHVVLVTGGAGSTGLELCLRLARIGPTALVVLERSEFSIYRLELRASFPQVPIRFHLCDVGDVAAVRHLMICHRPQMAFRAAAPIPEGQVREAVQNNDNPWISCSSDCYEMDAVTKVCAKT